MARFWRHGLRIGLVLCIAGVLVGVCVQKFKQHKLFQTANEMRARAEKGDPKAQFNLASMYYYGKGLPQDYAQAAGWYRKSAEQGDALAEFSLGLMYYNGTGLPQDYNEAASWYRKAGEQGETKSQVSLASMYFYGKGVPQDFNKAVCWTRKAAEQGEPFAEFGLGSMYREGKGVHQDYSEAIRWYRKAASHGSGEAAYNLGYMYHKGEGLPQDYNEAIRWYHESANRGYPDAKLALQSLERNSTIITWIDYFVFLVALIGGCAFSLDFVWRGRISRNSRRTTALGVVSLCYAGLSLYGITHDHTRYSTCRNLFHLTQGILIGMSIIIGVSIVTLPTRKSST